MPYPVIRWEDAVLGFLIFFFSQPQFLELGCWLLSAWNDQTKGADQSSGQKTRWSDGWGDRASLGGYLDSLPWHNWRQLGNYGDFLTFSPTGCMSGHHACFGKKLGGFVLLCWWFSTQWHHCTVFLETSVFSSVSLYFHQGPWKVHLSTGHTKQTHIITQSFF